MLDVANELVSGADGCVIDTLEVEVQPLASTTVTPYDPLTKLVAVAVVCPSLHEYVYGVVPPVTVTVAEPVALP